MELDNIDLNKLRLFLAVAEAGAVTPAAARVALTRSAVSHSVRALEAELGVALFHRIGKRLVPTSEGRLLRSAVSDMRERLNLALEQVVGIEREVRGSLRIGLFLGFSRFRLAHAVDHFTAQYQNADVRVSYGPRQWLTEQLLAGKLDMTLSLRPTGEHAHQIRSTEVPASPLVLALKKSRVRAPRDFARLRTLSFVDYYQTEPLIDRWTRHHYRAQTVPRERIRVWAGGTDLALELVLRGTGAAVLPKDMVQPFLNSGVSIIMGPGAPLIDHVWLNELAGSRPSRAALAFRAQLAVPGTAHDVRSSTSRV